MRSKYLMTAVILLLSFTILVPMTHAFTPVHVILDGEQVNFTRAGEINGNTMVPFRELFETLGASVTYDENTKVVSAQKDGVKIQLTVNSFEASVDGVPYTLIQAPILSEETVYVNLRFISEGIGYQVHWDKETATVYINSK